MDRQKIFLAALGGILMTLAFPKAGLDWLAWISLVPLLAAVRGTAAADGFRLGIIAGGCHYATLLYWLVGTMNVYGGLPFFLSVPILFFLCLYLSLYTGIFAAAASREDTGSPLALVTLPALWVLLEYVQSFFLTGFPWELLGYSQFRRTALIQIADLTGVYGLSFAIVLVNVSLFSLAERFRKGARRSRSLAAAAAMVLVPLMAVGGMALYGHYRTNAVDLRAQSAEKARIAVVQGNIDQARKWDRAFQVGSTEKYIDLSLEVSRERPELIVWPETATPFYLFEHKVLTAKVLAGIESAGVPFLIGSPHFTVRGKTVEYLNSAFLIPPEGNPAGRYDKVHLVPFGEYVPLKRFLPFLGKIVQHVGDFRAGDKGRVLSWGERRIGVQICYEIIFPGLSRAAAAAGADFLVNITNDAWFGTSSAPYQHFSMAVFRAVENRRPLIRAANTGISGFVDPAGRIAGKTALFRDETLTCAVPRMELSSFYTRFGDLFAQICAALTVVVALRRNFKYINLLKCKRAD